MPFNLKSRLLAPTEREYVPGARTHVWLDTSQTDRSYLESVTLTVFDSPGCNSTSVKPRRMEGGSPAPEGKCRYTCDIYFWFARAINRLIRDKEDKIRRTSVPTTWPAFCTVYDTVYAGRCNQSAVDETTHRGPCLAANQFASSCPSWSCPALSSTGVILRPEYRNWV